MCVTFKHQMTIQSPLVYELYNLASSERHLHHCGPGRPDTGQGARGRPRHAGRLTCPPSLEALLRHSIQSPMKNLVFIYHNSPQILLDGVTFNHLRKWYRCFDKSCFLMRATLPSVLRWNGLCIFYFCSQ